MLPALPLPGPLLTSSTIFLPWGTAWRKLWITWSCSMGRSLVFAGAALTRKGREHPQGHWMALLGPSHLHGR